MVRRVLTPVDIKQARKADGSTQAEWAYELGVTIGTIQNWEATPQRVTPTGAARRALEKKLAEVGDGT